MRESARAGLSWIRAHSEELGISREMFEKNTLHIHVPAGAIPKDGPSAGITMALAMVSAFTAIPVRKDVAMTGEITLRGRVLPIGGLKEKALAAHRADIHEIIIPKENEKDLEEIPEEVREAMDVHLVESMDEVLRLALDGSLTPLAKSGKFAEASEPPVGPDTLAPEVLVTPQNRFGRQLSAYVATWLPDVGETADGRKVTLTGTMSLIEAGKHGQRGMVRSRCPQRHRQNPRSGVNA